ncbi:YfhO family protein [Mesonia maritima]|uniref:Membrane protein YfhO n=1 Tax=Mesonia maritima TaxID=1793873 RepID=A0ABU1K9A0_9FLAO|nr:YfhO family protein [Mesonia maritima]MDR6302175.1 hypothetical protein [Mesonia maritima]
MTYNFKRLIPHFLVLLGFIIIALFYFHPVLQGKVIYQSDIVQYTGMAKQQNDFRAENDAEPYWTDAAFGGMPTYQLGANYPHNYIKQLDRTLRFLPRPADYLFLYFIGLYILLLCLKVDYKLAFLGALAFGFSTYLIILLGVGHNSKAHAIAYMPVVLAGIILCFRKKYIGGGLLLALGMALEISANHFQMTYYLLLLVIVLGFVYFIDFFKKKKLPQFFSALGVMAVAVILAIGANATNLLATQEYTQFSTRGKSEISINPDGTPDASQKAGLDYDYITEYSYGGWETFNLFIPRFMGGSSSEELSTESASYNYLLNLGATPQQAKSFTEGAPTYWGEQTYIGAPAYIGASVIFLFVFALFLVRGKLKWWVVGGSILALFLSLGDNFSGLTKFFIENVPLYNKFRAVSSIQVIIELCVPILAVVGLAKLFQSRIENDAKKNALKWATIIAGGLSVFFLLMKSVLFDFSTDSDRMFIEQLGPDFINALIEDRKAMFTTDAIRSLVFVLLIASLIWFYLKNKLSHNLVIAGVALLILVDLIAVDKRYVNEEDFVSKRQMEEPFQMTATDQEILQDEGHYRVLDLSGSPLNSARASYFHNSLGGYHAAKPKRIQQLFDFHIYKGNKEVLNMLNTKYSIHSNQGKVMMQENFEANGNAWFVENIKIVENANDEILALDSLNTKKTAIVQQEFEEFIVKKKFAADSSATIQLESYQPNKLTYSYKTENDRVAVFSEIYYPGGWVARVDGKEIPHFRADFVLRAALLPAGNHELTFSFEPAVIQTGSMLSLISCIILLILLILGILYKLKQRKA